MWRVTVVEDLHPGKKVPSLLLRLSADLSLLTRCCAIMVSDTAALDNSDGIILP